jgi:superfamily II DNA or RNA helicase
LALFALDQFILTEPRTVAMVVVPNRHALGEWEGLIKSKYPEKVVYSFTSVDEAKNSDLSDRIRVKLREDFIVVLVTYQLFASLGFQTILRRNKNKTFYVFDECFLLCQRQWTDLCPLAPDSARIGLTSTPTKWLSEGNEKRLQEHFGSVVWEVMLSDLLGESLTDYHYQAHLSELIISEYSQYKQLTHLIHTAKKDIAGFDSLPDKIIQYLDQREAILESAYNKAGDFINFYHAHGEKRAIVYVGVDQIDSMKERMEFEFHLKIEAFKPEMPMAQRLRLIKGFLAEQIDLLITAEAFNEGLDSLKPKAIYLLSSPGSPRVFFQRRNLILTAPGEKKKPIIHDFVTIAPREGLLDSKQKEIVIRELPRVMELSRLAGKSELTELMEYLASCDLAHEFGEADPVKINRELYLKDEPYLE